jgi:hypothetical protein
VTNTYFFATSSGLESRAAERRKLARFPVVKLVGQH